MKLSPRKPTKEEKKSEMPQLLHRGNRKRTFLPYWRDSLWWWNASLLKEHVFLWNPHLDVFGYIRRRIPGSYVPPHFCVVCVYVCGSRNWTQDLCTELYPALYKIFKILRHGCTKLPGCPGGACPWNPAAASRSVGLQARATMPAYFLIPPSFLKKPRKSSISAMPFNIPMG